MAAGWHLRASSFPTQESSASEDRRPGTAKRPARRTIEYSFPGRYAWLIAY